MKLSTDVKAAILVILIGGSVLTLLLNEQFGLMIFKILSGSSL